MKLDITKNFLSNLELWSKYLIVASVILFFGVIVTILATNWAKSKRFSFNNKLILFTASLTISMWCLQFLADYVNNDCPAETWFELLAFSFGHTFKSFGGDDNFLEGIRFVESLLSDSTQILLYRIYAVVLSFIAPITSATVLFEIIANIFPKVRHGLYFWRKKYYFSELNEGSLSLAKSILKQNFPTKSFSKIEHILPPVIVFTDVYADKGQEHITELLNEAKRLGAICLRDDITHLRKNTIRKNKFFLIDNNEVKNLQTLTNLTDKFNRKSLKNAEVYLFCQNQIYSNVEKLVSEKLKNDNGSELNTIIIPVRCYRNLITNMLEKTPLYEPIVQQRKDSPNKELNLNVTILGIGDIGTEMFLTTYWMGQMLNCQLNINVVSKESEEEFWGKIDYINPEIRRTTQENDELLRVYEKKNKPENEEAFAAPYCKVKYYSCDIQSNEFRKLLEDEDGRKAILDTHYFLVSLGSDQANLSTANTLKNKIGEYHIINANKGDESKRTVINYVVYNADLSKTLNQNKKMCTYCNTADIYMQAVGGVEKVYSAENIFMIRYIDASKAAENNYNAKGNTTSTHPLANEYTYWANLSQCLHFKYKVFSLGYIKSSVFDNENYMKDVKSACENYIKTYKYDREEDAKNNTENNKINPTEDEMKLHWLERRRWCATTRVNGWRSTKDYEFYYPHTGKHKHEELNLHPCLVESCKNASNFKLDSNGKFVQITPFVDKNPDQLDVVTANVTSLKKEQILINVLKDILKSDDIQLSDTLAKLDNETIKKTLVEALKNEGAAVDINNISSSVTVEELAKKSWLVGDNGFKVNDFPNNNYLNYVLKYLEVE